MPTLAVVTSSPPGVEGGHMVIARALVDAARESGHDARLVVTPDFGFGRNWQTYVANWRADIGEVDQVISLRHPSYAVRHDVHVCWLNHTIREYYDLWPRWTGMISAAGRCKERVRRLGIHAADWWLLNHHVTRVVAQSRTIQGRLAADLGVRADVLWPPAPQRPYRCDGYGDYIFALSRLTPLKRMDLLVRALAEPEASGVRAVIAGDGESRDELVSLARELGVDGRVTFLGRVSEAAALDHFARCRAVCFPPYAEDYGFVTVEAFSSRKAVITCRDSGGPTELVDASTGFVVDPTPSALARALAQATNDAAGAERLGAAAAARAGAMSWPSSVSRLLMV